MFSWLVAGGALARLRGFRLYIGSNCPGISGTVPDFLPLSRVPEGPIVCPGSKLGSCTMSHFLLQVIRMSNSTWSCTRIGKAGSR